MGNKKSNTKTISDVLSSNPLSISLIGISPIMLMTTSLIKGLVAGLATAFVIFGNLFVYAVIISGILLSAHNVLHSHGCVQL